MLVFDGADHESHMVNGFLPSGNQGNILVSSRNPSMCHISPGAFAEIDIMDKESSISLLLNSALLDPYNEELREESEKIAKELWFLPLAVDQAGAAIASGFCSIWQYREMYRQHHQVLLEDDAQFKGASNYGRAVYGTWDVSFDAIKARIARQPNSDEAQVASMAIFILQIFSFFHHEGVTEEIFCQAAENRNNDDIITKDKLFQPLLEQINTLLQLNNNGTWNQILFRRGIQVLQSCSFIKKSKDGSVYSMHQLVHSWSQDRIAKPAVEVVACLAK